MAPSLRPAWYILNYHDVSWEESAFIRHIGGTCPPDVFHDHVRMCAKLGHLVSVQDGMHRLKHDDIHAPLFSFWFDDGYYGVRRYAAPILAEHGVTGATAICSRFITRKEMFWRLKLSYLESMDVGRHLRSRLRKCGYINSMLVREFTLDDFGREVLAIIDDLYQETASEAVREDAFRIFDTADGLLELHKMGWVIANHSAAHYPIGEKHVNHILVDQFEECEAFIRNVFGMASEYWVFPFGRNIERAAIDAVRAYDTKLTAVLVDNRVNCNSNYALTNRVLYRITPPVNSRKRFVHALFNGRC
jgi:peptidoglycan/xylan/chitin deacetylase (PgdA/CDA1 family)